MHVRRGNTDTMSGYSPATAKMQFNFLIVFGNTEYACHKGKIPFLLATVPQESKTKTLLGPNLTFDAESFLANLLETKLDNYKEVHVNGYMCELWLTCIQCIQLWGVYK